MAEYCPFVFFLPMCPSTVHRYFDSLCVRVRCCLIPAHPDPPGNSGNSGIILGIVVRNVFDVRQNHFHGLGNYWEVIFTHSYSLASPWEFRESGILGILVRNSFGPSENHFHGLGNYWEVIFTHWYSLTPPWKFGNSGNSCAK